MAIIKCEYRQWRCSYGDLRYSGRICEHHNYCNSGFEYDDSCEVGNCEPYAIENGMIAIPFQCRYVVPVMVMFEKNVRSFEYDDYFGLKIGRKLIEPSFIRELVIDGKEIIKDKDPHETADETEE